MKRFAPAGQIRISRPGWCYLVVLVMIFAAAIVREINLVMVIAGMMVGPLLYSGYAILRSFLGLRVTRRVTPRTTAGGLLEVEIEVTNRRRRGSGRAIAVEDRIVRENDAPGVAPLRSGVWLDRITAKHTERAVYRCRLMRRGRYRLGPMTMSTRFPLGLLERIRRIDTHHTVTVWPRLGRLMHGWTQTQHEAYQASRQTARRHGFLEGDFHGLRDWRPGDSRRWIHWRTTARHGELMVRQFEQQRNQDLVLLVELWRPDKPEAADLENIELAVSFAATVIADRCRRGGSRLTLGIAARETVVTAGPASMAFHHDAMESLAVAEATSSDPLPSLLPHALAEVRQGSGAVLISTRPVELSDTRRFVDLWDDPRLRRWVGRMIQVDTGHEQLGQYFVPE